MTVPDGAQLSEDGKYWWDGADWQPVPEGGEQSTEVGQLSEDGKWQWDGSQWQPAGDGAGGGAGGGADALVGALAGQGINLAPEAADPGYIQQVAAHVSNWYEGLDENAKAIVDALSKQGADTLLTDPEVGVVSEGDPLITAFSGTDMTLHESLMATNQALEQTA
ncbi:MAG: hypothetical protein WBA97_40340 [Actinophytocola sp.]|uniref:hypothetical protein n=1 Tax=Actinophytocola sp. TaxID=1872138 RepID=UPI003C71C580